MEEDLEGVDIAAADIGEAADLRLIGEEQAEHCADPVGRHGNARVSGGRNDAVDQQAGLALEILVETRL